MTEEKKPEVLEQKTQEKNLGKKGLDIKQVIEEQMETEKIKAKVEGKKVPVKEEIKNVAASKSDKVKDEKDNIKKDVTKKDDTKVDDKKDTKKKKEEPIITKKDFAIAYGRNLHISKKHGVYICSFIKNKSIDEAIFNLEEVKKKNRAIPFKGEIPHRKGKRMMSGRYPVKASDKIISVLKALKGNVLVNGMILENSTIAEASANWARRPMRSKGRSGKRTNIMIKAIEVRK